MSKASAPPGTNRGYRKLVLFLLTVVYGFNFIDRQILGILAPYVQADLDLTNTQLGLLIGLAFAMFYTIMGIPIAMIADRVNRVGLLAIALAVWSGFTALTGMAQNFVQIGLARVGVGIGEAGGSPPSHSILSDMYAKHERSGALGVYSLGIPLGIMSAYFITAALMGTDPNNVDWRRIFIILGGSGIVMALIVRLLIREPERGAMEKKDGKGQKFSGLISIRESWEKANLTPRFLIFGGLFAIQILAFLTGSAHWLAVIMSTFLLTVIFLLSLQPAVMTLVRIPSWWFMALGIATASFAAYALSGFQTKYLRLLDPNYDFRTLVIWLGILNGITYAGGTYLGAKIVDWWSAKDVRAYGWVPMITLAIALPLGLASFAVTSVNAHLVFVGLVLLCIGAYLGPSFAIAQTLAPIHIRATSTALFFFVLNIIALGGGPTFAGWLIDVFEQTKEPLVATRHAMMWVFGAFAVAIGFFFLVTLNIRKDWDAAELRNEG